MKLLFVNACPRRSASRTLRLANLFLHEFLRQAPQVELIEHDLESMCLHSIHGNALAVREEACNHHDWTHPLTRNAVDLQQADAVVIAAPYWDLSFPAMLKVWVEHMYIRNLTFHYGEKGCEGHCHAVQSVYITTSGSPIGDQDWGSGYLRAVLGSLGIEDFATIAAEGLDLDESAVPAIMAAAEERIRAAARQLAQKLIG